MADGYLNFDTKVDTQGFNKGTKSITNSLGGLKSALGKVAVAAAAAFSVAKIISYAKESKAAYDTQIIAEQKLETIMRQRMSATDESIKSIKEFASAQQELGVIGDEVQLAGAQQVATFLNEADSIKTLLPAMNNLLAQQKGLNATSEDAVNIGNLMGKVMQGQTSALKRVGVTFTEAEEQVLKFGTESEKAAMLAKVITNNVGEMNAVLAKTDAGRQAQLANTMGDIKEQFGAAVTQIQVIFLPFLQKLASGLSSVATLAQRVAQTIADAFGAAGISTSTANVASNAESAAGSYDAMAESAESAQKANDKSLAGFDKINKLSDSKSSGGSSAAVPTSAVAVTADTKPAEKAMSKGMEALKKQLAGFSKWLKKSFGDIFSGIWDGLKIEASELTGTFSKMTEDIRKLVEPFKSYMSTTFTTYLQQVFSTSGGILTGLFDSFNMVFADLWNVAVFPILQNFLTLGLPLITEFATQMWSTASVLFESLKTIFDTLWTGVVTPLLAWITQAWIDLWAILSEFWNTWGVPIFDGIRSMIETIKDLFMKVWESFLKPTFDKLMEVVDKIWDDHLKPLLANFLDFVGELITGATNIYNKFIAPIAGWLIEKLGPVFTKVFGNIFDKVEIVIGGIIDIVSGLIRCFKGVVEFITGVFTGDWEKAWKGIKDIFGGIWDALVGVISVPLNFIIGCINKMLSAVESGINWVIDGINKISFDVPDWVPKIGGKKFGFNLDKIDIPEIPQLAKGAVIPPNSEFLAILGDQKHGTNVEAPLSTIKQAVAEVLAQMGGCGKQSITIPIYLQTRRGLRLLSTEIIDDINDIINSTGNVPINI